MTSHVAALGVGIVLTAVSQVLLRSGARNKSSLIGSFLNPHTLLGYGLFLAVTVLNVYAMQTILLKTVTAWVSMTYVATMILSRWLLKEELNRFMLMGAALIVAGIVVFSL